MEFPEDSRRITRLQARGGGSLPLKGKPVTQASSEPSTHTVFSSGGYHPSCTVTISSESDLTPVGPLSPSRRFFTAPRLGARPPPPRYFEDFHRQSLAPPPPPPGLDPMMMWKMESEEKDRRWRMEMEERRLEREVQERRWKMEMEERKLEREAQREEKEAREKREREEREGRETQRREALCAARLEEERDKLREELVREMNFADEEERRSVHLLEHVPAQDAQDPSPIPDIPLAPPQLHMPVYSASDNIDTYIEHFEAVAAAYQLSDQRKALYLIGNLTGKAKDAFVDIPTVLLIPN